MIYVAGTRPTPIYLVLPWLRAAAGPFSALFSLIEPSLPCPARQTMPLQRIRNTFLQLGPLDGSLYFFDYALRRLSRNHARLTRYYLVAQPVPGTSSCRPSASNPVVLLDPRDPLVALFPRPPEVIAERLRNQAQCFVARAGDEFAGFLWLALRAYDEDEVRCRYELAEPASCAWDYDVHVEPKYRISRTFARLWDAANGHLSKQGIRWSMSRISAFNPTSLSVHGKLGIRKLYSASFLCLGPLQISLIGAAPWFHVSLRHSSRPTLRLAPPGHD